MFLAMFLAMFGPFRTGTSGSFSREPVGGLCGSSCWCVCSAGQREHWGAAEAVTAADPEVPEPHREPCWAPLSPQQGLDFFKIF